MIRVTDQYFWNVVFGLFFLLLATMGAIILESESIIPLNELTLVDFALVTLASWRVVQLFVSDHITRWLREQFYDIKKVGKGYTLVKPTTGPRRTLADLFSSPWCFGIGASAAVTFGYLITPYAYYLVLFLAISAVATFLQIFASAVSHRETILRQEIE